jgi:hypothetical protein
MSALILVLTGIGFVIWAVIDSRVSKPVDSRNPKFVPQDSRTSKPVDSRATIPQDSRT